MPNSAHCVQIPRKSGIQTFGPALRLADKAGAGVARRRAWRWGLRRTRENRNVSKKQGRVGSSHDAAYHVRLDRANEAVKPIHVLLQRLDLYAASGEGGRVTGWWHGRERGV